MCNKHSFIVDNEGKVYNGSGFTESHTAISYIYRLSCDKVNKYEYNPYNAWDTYGGIQGLCLDTLNHEVTKHELDNIQKYLDENFPTYFSFDNYSNIKMSVEEAIKYNKDNNHCRLTEIIAESYNLSEKEFSALALDESPITRKLVAGNCRVPIQVLERLSTDTSCMVRGVVAGHRSTPIPTLLRMLLFDGNIRVKKEVLKNHAMSKLLKRFAVTFAAFIAFIMFLSLFLC